MTKDQMLNMLEELLSLTEPIRDSLHGDEYKAWERISATAADLRDGDDV
jgi:hypothetical protein